MNKIRTTIIIDKELLSKAKEHRVSISSFLDIELRKYIAIIKSTNYSISKYKKTMIDSTQPHIHFQKGKTNNSIYNILEDSGLWGSLVSLWLREP